MFIKLSNDLILSEIVMVEVFVFLDWFSYIYKKYRKLYLYVFDRSIGLVYMFQVFYVFMKFLILLIIFKKLFLFCLFRDEFGFRFQRFIYRRMESISFNKFCCVVILVTGVFFFIVFLGVFLVSFVYFDYYQVNNFNFGIQ